jgi:hypothetical protein
MKTHKIVKHVRCYDDEIDLTKFKTKTDMMNLYKDHYTDSMWKILMNLYYRLPNR